jgi:succinylglutamate desuccinylase
MKRVSTNVVRAFTPFLLLAFLMSAVLVAPAPAQASTREKVVLAKGTSYATDMYIIRSGKPGPVVMIVGGVHGNEPAGYTAAGKMTDTDIKKGTLVVIPKANRLAIEHKSRYYKGHGDLNRDFPQGNNQSADGTLSRAIWAAVTKYNVDYLMDMHEGYDYYKNKSTSSVGQSLIYYPNSSLRPIANSIVNTLNGKISSNYREFSLLQYPAKGSLARASAQYLGTKSFIFETCTKVSLSTRVSYQQQAANILLKKLSML